MKASSVFLIVIILGGLAAAPPARASQFTLVDGDFQTNDWDVSLFESTAGGAASGTQVASGGNPGAYRATYLSFHPRTYGVVRSFHRYVPFTFDAATHGPLLSVDYSEDSKSGTNNQAAAPALRQGGRVYVGPTFATTPSWVHHAFTGLTQNDFLAGATDHPDFSALGAPIEFGFFRGNSGEGSWSTSACIDNWTITIHQADDVPGACCDESSATCTLILQSDCPAPYVWHGEWTSCEPNPCPRGNACCLGASCADLTEEECAATGGLWVGSGILCALDPCSMIPGSCCRGEACTIESATSCDAGGGSWNGPYSDCDPDPCLSAGACCALDGSCTSTPEEECPSPDIWLGVGTICFPDPCILLPGACCAPDGSCSLTTEEECTTPDSWQGLGTDCTPNECIPMGACCYADGGCEYLTWADCLGAGGVYYMGVGTSCDPNPCPASSVGEGLDPSLKALSVTPNPSTGRLQIRYRTSVEANAVLEIYDAAGARVRRLCEGRQSPGAHSMSWDGRDDHGNPVRSGVYLVRLETPTGQVIGKVTLTR